jgi:acetyl esterase/lipase
MARRVYFSKAPPFATKTIADPGVKTVPTRHGGVGCLVYRPSDAAIAAAASGGYRPAAHVQIHDGAFITRVPRQEDSLGRHLASEVGCYVIIPNYDTGPTAKFPVVEEQNYDVFEWVHNHGPGNGWDGERVSVGGSSAGGKFALNVTEMAIDAEAFTPAAVAVEYALGEITRADAAFTSEKKNPVVAPRVMELVTDTYFASVHDFAEPLVSPTRYDRLAEFPPTLITTAEYDPTRHAMNRLARRMAAQGVDVTHREFGGVDHGYANPDSAKAASEAITMIRDHLRRAFSTDSNQRERPSPPMLDRRSA